MSSGNMLPKNNQDDAEDVVPEELRDLTDVTKVLSAPAILTMMKIARFTLGAWIDAANALAGAESKTDEEDYPAAHSMDTSWYAVDADGNLGYFSTGEAGIVPDMITHDGYEMTAALAAAGVEYDLGDIINTGGAFSSSNVRLSDHYYSCLLLASSEEARSKLLKDTKESFRIKYQDKFPLYVEAIPSDYVLNMLKKGTILKGWSSHSLDAERFGTYIYGYDDYSFGEPYEKEKEPKGSCLNVSALPDETKKRFPVKFTELSFANEQKIWPRRYFRCFGWGDEIE